MAALDKEMDVFDVSHVEKGTEIEHEIAETGVKIYEKWCDYFKDD